MHVRPLFTVVLVISLQLVLTGCATPPKTANKADNVHKEVGTLPGNIRRVAVLPLAGRAGDEFVADGCEALSSIVFEEFAKTKKFEAVRISPETLRDISGASSWTGGETLPANLLNSFNETEGCDAVLFSELTIFQPYAPITVGWRLKLVDTKTQKILWAVDEIFDTAKLSSATEARHKMRDAVAGFYQSPKEDWTDLHSPERVGRSSVDIVLATLPTRE
ncbi:MAG TPA: hypothetical protein VH255_08805 [Verrucomicrobiae bacterium]|nr:hypothetical protein [Verrucomicrobiae bacterium]